MKIIDFFFKVLYIKNWNKRFQCINWWKIFFWCAREKKEEEEEAYEKIIETGKNNDHTTGNLLDYKYFSKHYKLIAIDLSKQIELENPDLKQQTNFIGKLKDEKAKMFFIIEKSEETTFEFSQNSVSII